MIKMRQTQFLCRRRNSLTKLKVMTVVGTRPEIIRLSRVIAKLDEHCDHTFVHTGQNYDYELNKIFFDDLKLRLPDHFLHAAQAGQGASITIANIIRSADELFASINPDCLLVLGDTNSCLAALPAKRRKIPIFHMEAGNRCFDFRVPEEINRRIVDHIADINLPYSDIAREYLLNEGIAPDRIIKTGSPMNEVLTFYKNNIQESKIITELKVEKFSYFLVSVHREENIESEEQFAKFCSCMDWLAYNYKLPVLVSTHPRTRDKINNEKIQFQSLVKLMSPLSFTDYVNLQLNAKMTLSDSGTITEESNILNFPALNLREAHERPEGMEEGAVMLTGLNVNRLEQGIDIVSKQSRGTSRQLQLVCDYDVDNVSEKVLRILHSYTDYINRLVWAKN